MDLKGWIMAEQQTETLRHFHPWVAVIGVVVVLVLAIGIATKREKSTTPELTSAPSSETITTQSPLPPLFGFSYSPSGGDPAKIGDFFAQAKGAGTAVTWAGDWQQVDEPTTAPHVIMELARRNNLTSIPILGIATNDNAELIRPLTPENRASYLDGLETFVTKYTPDMIGLGIEVNTLAAKRPSDYAAFRELFAQAAQKIHSISPDTEVFTTFQVERMKGLHGGLFGGKNDPVAATWDLLDDFPDADLVGFTTYPGIIYSNPEDIPAEYYTELSQKTSKSIIVSELGWFRDGPAGWESSVAEQADFIERFGQLTDSLTLRAIIWSFLYDQPAAAVPFDTAGLLQAGLTDSEAFEAWQKLR